MSQGAQLGPIDVQLRKEEEVGERRSGLVAGQAMDTLSTEAGKTFFRMFRLMRQGGLQLPTRLAAETAATMAIGIMEPIYAQLDPIRIGEIERFVNIALEYGERLRTSNVRKDTIEQLLSGYPSHEFVIDRKEAGDLFERVEVPPDDLELVAETFIGLHHPTAENMSSFVQFLNPPTKATTEIDDVEAEGSGNDEKRPRKRALRVQKRPAAARSTRGNGAGPSANGGGRVEQ